MTVSKRPYIKVTMDGTESFIEEVKEFLSLVMDWKVTDDISKYPLDVFVTHGIDAKHGKDEFWIIKREKKNNEV